MNPILPSLVVSLAFLGVTLNAVRKRALSEQHALLWVGVALAMLLIVVTLPLHFLDWLSRLAGIVYPPDLLFLAAIIFILVLQFHLTLAVSKLTSQVTRIAQEVAIRKEDQSNGAKDRAAHFG